MINAKPIWIKNKDREMNFHGVFTVTVPNYGMLSIAATVFYRIFINGRFVAFGPARTAKGYMRKDEFGISRYVVQGEEEAKILIEVMSYQCRSLSTALQPPCIMAEVSCGEKVVAWTGEHFDAFVPNVRIPQAERFSIHRYFCEIWDYSGGYDLLREENRAQIYVTQWTPTLIDRVVPYPKYVDVTVDRAHIVGQYHFDENLEYRANHYPWEIPAWWGAFAWDSIPYHPYEWLQRQTQIVTGRNVSFPLTLNKGEYCIIDLKQIEAGFLNFTVNVSERTDLVVGFSEYYHGDTFALPNMDVHSVMEWILAQTEEQTCMCFEPYTYRYVVLMVKEGCLTLRDFGVKTYEFDISGFPLLDSGNKTLDLIYKSALRTFAHNAVDVFSDCPSRERAGWLCDSYFTAKAEYALTGKTTIEDAFLQNYCLYKNEGELPEGMIPEAYPSDVRPGTEFIPQWALWYILEVEEYIFERGHLEQAEQFYNSIRGVLDFFAGYENELGLLEKLPSRNFVEWSKANAWTQDVNFPTNFLYARALESAFRLFGDEAYLEKSKRVRHSAKELSFIDGLFFDHAVRRPDGGLEVLPDCSEACQYYAILFAEIDLDDEEYQHLKYLVFHVFTPDRTQMPEIEAVNAFIGAYLRIEVLLKYERYALLLDNICDLFGKMGEYTGTLWENRQFEGSYDHGFASYAAVAIIQALNALKNKRNHRERGE